MASIRFSAVFAVAALAVALCAHAQETFPTKPVRFIFPSTAGGVGANVMHVLAEKLTAKWGQPVIVEPRPGANTAIGTDYVAKAPADGHTILLASSQIVILHHTMRSLPFDALRDFEPVTTVAKLQYLLAVDPKLPVNNLQDFIALAKAKPNAISFGSGGAGGPAHLAAEQFSAITGVKMLHVPYNNKGAAVVLADLMASTINVYFTPPGISGYVDAGKLKALATSGTHRPPKLPDVPTFSEAGLPNFEVSAWYGVLAPAGTPKPIVDKIAKDFADVIAMPDVQAKLMSLEVEPFVAGPAQFSALMRADYDRYTRLIKDQGLVLSN